MIYRNVQICSKRAPFLFAARSFAIEDQLHKELSYRAQLKSCCTVQTLKIPVKLQVTGAARITERGTDAMHAQCSNGMEINSMYRGTEEPFPSRNERHCTRCAELSGI